MFRWLFTPLAEPRTGMRIIGWWELRRIPYNLLVGLTYLASLFLFYGVIDLSGTLAPGEDPVEPIMVIVGTIALVIGANLCYTAGWVVELLVQDECSAGSRTGPRLLKVGLLFSIGLVALPALLSVGVACARLIFRF